MKRAPIIAKLLAENFRNLIRTFQSTAKKRQKGIPIQKHVICMMHLSINKLNNLAHPSRFAMS